jgi:hypothetical protein
MKWNSLIRGALVVTLFVMAFGALYLYSIFPMTALLIVAGGEAGAASITLLSGLRRE